DVTAASCFRSVETTAEINPVKVELHDFLFAELLLDSARQKNFEQFAAKRFFLERKTVARQLLCNRARALTYVARREVFQRGTDDPHQIVSLMPIKFRVLDGDYCVDEIAGQLIVRHCIPVLDVDLAEY